MKKNYGRTTDIYNVNPSLGYQYVPQIQSEPTLRALNTHPNYNNKFLNTTDFNLDNRLVMNDRLITELETKKEEKESVNTVVKETKVSITSSNRRLQPQNNYDEIIYKSNIPYPIQFKNGSKILKVHYENHPFSVNDKISLFNVKSKIVRQYNIISVKKNSEYIRVNHINHGMSIGKIILNNPSEFEIVSYVGQLPVSYTETADIPDGSTTYYILKENKRDDFDLSVRITEFRGNNQERSLIGNIPSNFVNSKHKVYLLFTKNGAIFELDRNNYLIKLNKRSTINYKDGVNYIKDRTGSDTMLRSENNIEITFLNLYGVPLNYINTGTPLSQNNKYPYHIILEVTKDTFSFDCKYTARFDGDFYFTEDSYEENFQPKLLNDQSRGGGEFCEIRKLIDSESGFPNPNHYVYQLDKTYNNVISVEMIESIFPNSYKTINLSNRRLYWRNFYDGDIIYKIEIPDGNYSTTELSSVLEDYFSKTIRYKYTLEYENNIVQDIIERSTPIDDLQYDEDGYSKYHIVKVFIDPETDIVEFSSFRELLQRDSLDRLILRIPDTLLDITMAENLRIDFADSINWIIPPTQEIAPFNPNIGERLYFYFTQKSHARITTTYPFSYGNVYKYLNHIPETDSEIEGINTFRMELEDNISFIFDFSIVRPSIPDEITEKYAISVNTNTLLSNSVFMESTMTVNLINHNLKPGDIIVTDQFVTSINPNTIFVHEVIEILDVDSFKIKRYSQGEGIKFIFEDVIINFNRSKTGLFTDPGYYWLDTIPPNTPLPPGGGGTLSLINVENNVENKKSIIVYHPEHGLDKGDTIIIGNSGPINSVPEEVINSEHTIIKIIDDNTYEVLLEKYTPLSATVTLLQTNTISIIYPDIFQMLFNFNDTMGKYLRFDKVGEEIAVTRYLKTIKNTDVYRDDYDLGLIGTEYVRGIPKLSMTGPNFFWICSPQLGNIRNTLGVENVFNKIRLYDVPGTIIFDGHIKNMPVLFDSPLSELGRIEFLFYYEDGTQVDFNGIDHSFVLLIKEISNKTENTGINPKQNSAVIRM